MNTISHRKIFYIFSGVLMLASIAALSLWRLNFGIDFTGGTLMEVRFFNERPSHDEIRQRLSNIDLGNLTLQATENNGLILRFKEVGEATHLEIVQALAGQDVPPAEILEEQRFDSIGPAIGQELKHKAYWAIGLSLIGILIFIALAFRKVSKPVASWKYGLAAVIALAHDILIVVGVFAVLGRFLNVEIDLAFVAALLTILGYSVNDTIVVFDRIRENLKHSSWDDFEQTLNISVNQTLTRSINTSLTTLFVLGAIFLFGGATIKFFILALIIGVVSGTYSSIFLATPFLLWWIKKRR